MNELRHFGVLGMKWGVRRSQQKLDRLTRRAKDQQAKRTEVRSTKGIGSKAAAITEGQYYVANGKFGIPSIGFEDGKIGVRVK